MSRTAEPKLGNRLRVARAEMNVSQEQLAGLVGVTRQTISAVETGLYCPSALLAFLLADRLGKRVDELFYVIGLKGEDQ
ncbi:MAG: helix-turn-helix transcriptional regulator [Dehalococcoidia bacterium]|nr:helix-turn-helix transcriptional regulator [Dehalococcoidia bacterium]